MSRRSDDVEGELTAAKWRRLEELLTAVLELPQESRRDFLDRECAGDAALRGELDTLLAAHDTTGFMDHPIAHWGSLATGASAGRLAPGATVASYEIQEQLGSGGMGIVYRARDLRLERTVALKFLPPALSANPRAKHRFQTEARAAASLDHVNVCTIHEIGESEEGWPFIAMAFVDGETLRQRIERSPLPAEQAVEIAHQIAAALRCAHERGIVHRDVKPANVMLGVDGVVKLVDFGVAKLEGSALTTAGVTPGTTAYMSPEQIRGEVVDHRTDLWSLGVVLYEMLAGRRPFSADTDAALLHAITGDPPLGLRALRTDVPGRLDRIVARALTKDRERRFQTAQEMQDALRRAASDAALSVRRGRWLTRRRLVPLVAAAIVGVLLGIPAWRMVAKRRALASLTRVEQLAQRESFVPAFALAMNAERLLEGDTTLQRLLPVVSDRLTILSNPPGAQAWLRRVADDGSLERDSMLVGVTPIRDLRVARADYRVDLRKEGFAPAARIASSALNRAEESFGVPLAVTIDVMLRESGWVPDGMLFVPGSGYTLVGREAPSRASVTLTDFYIDAHEVTNAQFREFVSAGGYDRPHYWRHPFALEGRMLSWSEAMRRLVDRTGLPGPRGWTGQEFPPDQDNHPVTGVTWYEAAAYAEFAGKRLPTVFEWEKTARDGRFTHFEHIVLPWGLADPRRGIARRANFGSSGTEAVDSHPSGISPYGASNMAGNVEEWVANPSGEARFITGGAWDDPLYVFANFLPVSGFHASPSLGFRCARDVEGTSGDHGGFEVSPGDATPRPSPVDDRTYQGLLRHYAYDRAPLEATIVDRATTKDWTRETIRIAGPWGDPTQLFLYTPLRFARPLQTIVFLPGVNVFFEGALPDETERILGSHIRAGRAVLAVLFKGMVGRPWDMGRGAPVTSSVQYRRELVLHATELRRSLDYLATRGDIDVTRLAYIGFSKGSGSWLPFAAVEPRFRSVVLIGAGFDERFANVLPEANSINFASRIAAPKLLLNGHYDEEQAWSRSALPLWELLREPKRLALVEGGHLPPAEVRVPVINAWLDETLGRVR